MTQALAEPLAGLFVQARKVATRQSVPHWERHWCPSQSQMTLKYSTTGVGAGIVLCHTTPHTTKASQPCSGIPW